MPSQEEYLDNVLNGLNESEEVNIKETDNNMDFVGAEIEEFSEPSSLIGVDDTIRLSEEDIDKLISEGESSVKEELSVGPEEDIGDLMDLLSQEDDSNLQEIQELLEKSDNNEAISEDIIALLQDTPDEESDLLEELMNEPNELEELVFDEKAQHAADRKREKDARKAEKAAQKEAKKAAKLEAKAAREAEKKAKKEAKNKALEESEKPSFEDPDNSAENVQQSFEEMDLSGLDVLFANTEKAEPTVGDNGEQEIETQAFENDVSEVTKASLVEQIVEEKRPQKKRVFSRIIDFFTEEVDDLESGNNEDIQLSDENKNIIEELDKDKGKKKKGKKGKKGGDRNPEDESETGSGKGKKDIKPKKEKKPKKVKEPKATVEEPSYRGGSKLSFKKVFPIALLCLSLAVIILLVANIVADYSIKQAGKKAYYNEDYETCYQNLYGKDLNESEQIMYGRSESILRIRLWIREYEMFSEQGLEAEALDSLIQSVNNYPMLYNYSVQWNAGADMEEAYAQILSILSEKYHLTEEQVLEIADTRADVDYSKMVYTIVDGGEFGSWKETKSEELGDEPEILEDLLPEEEDMADTAFVDNNN